MNYIYIVYQTLCTVNNKIYIGVHKTLTEEFDGYLGCGVYINRPATYKNANTPFKHAVAKYGVKSFKRTILKTFTSETDAYKLEAELVNEEFVRREDTYNLALGGRDTSMGNDKVKVYMYDLDGNFEMEFESLHDAARYLKPSDGRPGHLPRAIRLGHQYLGHQFSYEKLPYMKKLKHRNITTVEKPYVGSSVGRFDDNGNLLETYSTMTECVKAGYANAKSVAQGKRKKCKGYVFKYLD